jgi:hypothetical protein
MDGDEYDVACEHPLVDENGYMCWREHRVFVGAMDLQRDADRTRAFVAPR